MKKIAVLVDSTAYMSEELKQNNHLKIVYQGLNIGNTFKKEFIEISTEEYANYLASDNQELPTTSQPAIGEVVVALEDLKKNGFTDVIAIALSSGISGTFASYALAASMVEGIRVHPFDSEVSCQAETFYVRKSINLIDEGKNATEIIEVLEEMKKVSKSYFIVDDLKHLERGGRLSSAQALLGSLLQVKPILHFEDKVIVPYQKIRTYKKAIAVIYDLFDEFYRGNSDKNIYVCVIHTRAFDKVDEIEAQLKSKYPNINIEKGEIGPIVTTHLGLGAVAVGWTIL